MALACACEALDDRVGGARDELGGELGDWRVVEGPAAVVYISHVGLRQPKAGVAQQSRHLGVLHLLAALFDHHVQALVEGQCCERGVSVEHLHGLYHAGDPQLVHLPLGLGAKHQRSPPNDAGVLRAAREISLR